MQANQELAQQAATCREEAAALTASMQQQQLELLSLRARLKGCSCSHAAVDEEPCSPNKLGACWGPSQQDPTSALPEQDAGATCRHQALDKQPGIGSDGACSNAGLVEDPRSVPLDRKPPRYPAARAADRGHADEAARSADEFMAALAKLLE